MSEKPLSTPREAEAVVDERIERFGLGSLPHVSVTALADGTWGVRWKHLERIVAPMTGDAWHAWLEENVGSLDAGDSRRPRPEPASVRRSAVAPPLFQR